MIQARISVVLNVTTSRARLTDCGRGRLYIRHAPPLNTRHIKKHAYWRKVKDSWRRMNASRRKMSI